MSYLVKMLCWLIKVFYLFHTDRWHKFFFILRPALKFEIRMGADKSLARLISRCCRAKSIVTLEREVCSCAKLQVSSCYRGWKKHFRRRSAIWKTWRRDLSSIFFFLQCKAPTEIHATLRETWGENATSYATVKIWVAQFIRGFFRTCVGPRPGRP